MSNKQVYATLIIMGILYYWKIYQPLSDSSPTAKLSRSASKTTDPAYSPLSENSPTSANKNSSLTTNSPKTENLNARKRNDRPLPTISFQNKKSLDAATDSQSSRAVPFTNYNGMAIAYGDVILGVLKDNVQTGFVLAPEVGHWPTALIPYHIQPNVVKPNRILQALAYLSEKTVLEFVPYEDGMSDAIVFEPTEQNCYSYVGRISGTQPIYISPGCDSPHIVHEVLHAIGLVHEHSRPDRDQFIKIQWDNIPAKYHSQFEILPDFLIANWLKYDYDSHSIMHYGSQKLKSDSNQMSLVRKDGTNIPEPQELSPTDIEKVNSLFR